MLFKKNKLTVKVYPTSLEMARHAMLDVSVRIKELLKEKESINMIFAAAPSQTEFLSELVSQKDIEWNRINAFHMDEYIGLGEDAPQKFGNYLKENIFSLLPFRHVYYLDGQESAEKECERYAKLLIQFPVDIVCLGIGENGHIAFNDPHVADFNDTALVKVVNLDEVCRQQQVNDKCFNHLGEVPSHALTLTIPALTRASYMYCVVPFHSKACAVYKTLNEEISETCPASILRTKEYATLYLDNESSSLLELT